MFFSLFCYAVASALYNIHLSYLQFLLLADAIYSPEIDVSKELLKQSVAARQIAGRKKFPGRHP